MKEDPKHPGDLADAVAFQDAARLLGVSVRTIQRLVSQGHIRPFYLPGSARPRIPLDQIVGIRKQTDRSTVPHRESPLERRRVARDAKSRRPKS